MSKNFPKLSNNHSDFPILGNVDVYKYDNDFDYGRFDYTQMELMICTVPWDMGEVHIGNRTLSGVGNVVYFESKKKRDEWFDAIPDSECYRFETKFKELHRDHVIDVPVPYDMCAKHNYLVVRYAMFANDDSPVKFEEKDGLREWFWFIREVEFVAPNTTRLHLLEDAWQTWIHDVHVTGMVLERGHAPMFSVNVDDYLSNPVENNENLLTEDVNFGDATQARHIDVLALNAGETFACIATTANPNGTWGSKANGDWSVPAKASYTVSGVPSVYVFAVKADDLETFLSNVNALVPQFKQTVQGVFFASRDLVTIGATFTFANTSCYQVTATRNVYELTKLKREMFGYGKRYENIAKLYTSPYAHIEITDENGNADIIKIEDTTGTISASVALSIAYPFVNIESHLLGTGGNAQATVTFKNITSHTFGVSGQWYDTLRSWKVPTFAVVLDAATEYDYGTHFDRAQRVVDYTTAYDNANASAHTTKTNADAVADANAANVATIAQANKTNTDASANANCDNVSRIAGANRKNAHDAADTLVANAQVNTSNNSLIATRSNQAATESASHAVTYNNNMVTADNTIADVTALSTIAANQMQGSISANAQMATAAMNTVQGLTNFQGGALFGIGNAAIGASATLASTSVSSGLTSTQAAGQKAGNTAHATVANAKTNDDRDTEKSARTAITGYQNDIITDTNANTAATQKGNATRTENAENLAAQNTRDTEKSNATRTQTAANTAAGNTQTTEKANNANSYTTATANAARNKTQAQSAIANDVSQAALRSPFVYGNFSDGESATTKPIALFSHVVTQSKGAISSAGDEMLRYGYTFDKQWEFDGEWNIGKYFTYWKLRDFWVSNLNVPDMYMDRLRFFLYGGVTIWRNPEDIGKKTIYENF